MQKALIPMPPEALPRRKSFWQMDSHIYKVTARDGAESVHIPCLSQSQGRIPNLSYCPSARLSPRGNFPSRMTKIYGAPDHKIGIGDNFLGHVRASFLPVPFLNFLSSANGFHPELLSRAVPAAGRFLPFLGLFFGWLWVRFLCSSARCFCRRWFGCFGALGCCWTQMDVGVRGTGKVRGGGQDKAPPHGCA